MSRFRLLYLDDEADNLVVLKNSFRKQFEISTYQSPEEALEAVGTHRFQIIVVDQRMPRMSGIEFLSLVQEIDPEPIRILLTAYTDTQALIDAINKGKVFYYVAKPWKYDEVQLILLKAIDHYLLTRRNRELLAKSSATLQELEVFLYRASHDLKSPIASQLGLLHLLKHRAVDISEDFIQQMESLILQLQNLLDNLSQLSSRVPLPEHTLLLDLNQAIHHLQAKFESKLQSTDLQLHTVLTSVAEFYFDTGVLQQILQHLLDNAIQFTSGVGSEISISTQVDPANTFLEIIIRDDGSGIKPEIQSRIFEPFFRGNEQSTGNGLGLYVASKLCEEMQVTMNVESDGIRGTCFTLRIPNLHPSKKALLA